MPKGGLIVAIMLLSGCAAHDEKAAIRKECRQPGHEADMRCRKRTPIARDLVEICEIHGSTRDCYYVDRRELERAIREAQGQR